tara:strand:- start:234 stop:392 length:159 start_codon:yes stop_codon:yes gene_type:complete
LLNLDPLEPRICGELVDEDDHIGPVGARTGNDERVVLEKRRVCADWVRCTNW